MADDRVFLRCKYCGGWKMLLKFFSSSGATHRDNGVLDWLDAHAECHPNRHNFNLGGDPGFTIHTEEDLVEGGALDWGKQNFVPKAGEHHG